MNGTSDIKIEDHHNHEKDNIKVIRDFEILCQKMFWLFLGKFSKNYAEWKFSKKNGSNVKTKF